jgi:mRNA interferase MazF
MTAGDVVLLNFPFSDLTGAKLRPAVVLAVVDRNDFIAVQVTSKQKSDPNAVELRASDFAAGGLRTTSYARGSKLFTAHRSIVVRRVGRLRGNVKEAIRDIAVRVIRTN